MRGEDHFPKETGLPWHHGDDYEGRGTLQWGDRISNILWSEDHIGSTIERITFVVREMILCMSMLKANLCLFDDLSPIK